MIRQITASTALLLVGAALMLYTAYTLYGAPYLCALVLAWLCFVEYAVARAWWGDLQEARVYRARRHRPTS